MNIGILRSRQSCWVGRLWLGMRRRWWKCRLVRGTGRYLDIEELVETLRVKLMMKAIYHAYEPEELTTRSRQNHLP